MLFWLLKRVFPSKEAPEQAPAIPRYVDEKRAKAIKQAALFAESGGKSGAPQCPRCGAEMTLELVRRGKQAGTRFWGCSQYPTCQTTRKA